MLIIDPKQASLLLVQDNEKDRELLARAEEFLGWKADEIQLFALARGHIEVDGKKLAVKSFRSVVGVDVSEQIEYEAYGLVDELLAGMPTSMDKNCVLTSYHEVATNWFRLMLGWEALRGKKQCVMILEPDYYTAFYNIRRKLGRKRIAIVDKDWKERQKGGLTLMRLKMRNGWRWFWPRVKRRSGLAGRLLERFIYLFTSKLIHWGGLLRIIVSKIVHRTRLDNLLTPGLVRRGALLRIIASKLVFTGFEIIKVLPHRTRLLATDPVEFGRRATEETRIYFYQSKRFIRTGLPMAARALGRVLYHLFTIPLILFRVLVLAYKALNRFAGTLPARAKRAGQSLKRYQGKWLGLSGLKTRPDRVLKPDTGASKTQGANGGIFSHIYSRIGGIFRPSKEIEPIESVELAQVLSNIKKRDIVLVTVSDSGTRVNLNPALKVLDELARRKITGLMLTDSPFVVEDCTKRANSNVVFTGAEMGEPAKEQAPLLPKSTGKRYDRVIKTALDALLQVYWPYHMRRIKHIHAQLEQIKRSHNIRAVFSVNDYLPVAVATGQWALEHRLPWVGHFPILVGGRPDGYFFPAPEQLTYGSQLRDHMISAGKDADKIKIVGSYTYDQHRSREREQDRRAIEKAFPRVVGKKLVTVGTEAFADPETELAPILSAVSRIKGVHVILKLHPEDSIEFFNEFAENLGVRDQIDIVKKTPLGQLLGASDLLMVVISNIAIEAAVIGTPTLMCDFSNKANVINFVDEGLCVGCSDPSRVGQTVENLLFDKACANNALEKMRQGIERFNGPNDGNSCIRVAEYIAMRSGLG